MSPQALLSGSVSVFFSSRPLVSCSIFSIWASWEALSPLVLRMSSRSLSLSLSSFLHSLIFSKAHGQTLGNASRKKTTPDGLKLNFDLPTLIFLLLLQNTTRKTNLWCSTKHYLVIVSHCVYISPVFSSSKVFCINRSRSVTVRKDGRLLYLLSRANLACRQTNKEWIESYGSHETSLIHSHQQRGL